MYNYNGYGYDASSSYSTQYEDTYYPEAELDDLMSVYSGVSAVTMLVTAAIILITSLLLIISLWKIFKKAGKHGWASIIPIYSNIVLIEIAGLPIWYLVLLFVPFANIYAYFKIAIEVAHKFGKSTGFGVASVFFPIVCLPMLAFGKCSYEGMTNNSSETKQNEINPNEINNQAGIDNNSFNDINNTSENSANANNNDVFTPFPVAPNFVPTSDINNNMQNDINDINNASSDTNNINDMNNISNEPNNNVMLDASGNMNNANSINNPVTEVTDNSNSNTVNLIDNSINNIASGNSAQQSIPEIQNIGIVPIPDINDSNNQENFNTINNINDISVNNVMENSVPNNNHQNVEIMPEMQNNNEEQKEFEENNSEPVINQSNMIEQNIMPETQNNTPSTDTVAINIADETPAIDNQNTIIPVNPEIPTNVPEMQSIPNIPNNNMSDTMSLNEILADINNTDQK